MLCGRRKSISIPGSLRGGECPIPPAYRTYCNRLDTQRSDPLPRQTAIALRSRVAPVLRIIGVIWSVKTCAGGHRNRGGRRRGIAGCVRQGRYRGGGGLDLLRKSGEFPMEDEE